MLRPIFFLTLHNRRYWIWSYDKSCCYWEVSNWILVVETVWKIIYVLKIKNKAFEVVPKTKTELYFVLI